jgi:hypothetical protein
MVKNDRLRQEKEPHAARAWRGPILKRGSTVTWTSSGRGVRRVKIGRVVAVLPAHARLSAVLKAKGLNLPSSRVRGAETAAAVRYVLYVPRELKRPNGAKSFDIYTPFARTVDKQMAHLREQLAMPRAKRRGGARGG